LGTNRVVFTAKDLELATPSVERRKANLDFEYDIVRELLTRFSTRREQIAEWQRQTGKCRRTFEHRIAKLRSP